jgi:two-component system, NtrC family, response regulator AtoC
VAFRREPSLFTFCEESFLTHGAAERRANVRSEFLLINFPIDGTEIAFVEPRACVARAYEGRSNRFMNSKQHIMVVDDDVAICEFLRMFLDGLGYHGITVNNAEEAVEQYTAARPEAVIMDVVMPGGMDGLGALAAFKKIDRDVPVIVISGQGRTNTVVQAMKLGAFDFISKPFDEADLEALLADALRQRRPGRDALLRDGLIKNSHQMLFGDSPRMREVRDLIERAAATDVTVLIRGESGTGKELVARALYRASARRDRPFVKVNCAALPSELLESELFGFERGAFTGAIQQKPGKFEFANKGTMFLDEIGDMSFPLQAKLLQVLQDGEFTRLGGKQDVRVDVRIVAATNRDLTRAVADGQFRDDLFFRLNVVSIDLPPLRERRDEIPILTEHFLRRYSEEYGKPYTDVSLETKRLFMDYAWPGNVRELQNLVRRAVVLGTESAVRKEMSLGFPVARERMPRAAGASFAPVPPIEIAAAPAPPAAPLAAAQPEPAIDGNTSLKDISRIAAREAERVLILRMLQQTRWNRKEAAQILGISYKALLYKIKDAGLDKAPQP